MVFLIIEAVLGNILSEYFHLSYQFTTIVIITLLLLLLLLFKLACFDNYVGLYHREFSRLAYLSSKLHGGFRWNFVLNVYIKICLRI